MKQLLSFSFAAFFIFSGAISAFACACCAEPGTYSIWTGKPDIYHTSLLKDILFQKDAALYMTEAGFDGFKGLRGIQKEYESDTWTATPGEFSLVNSFKGTSWRFELKTKAGKAGSVTLPLPPKMLVFKADLHDSTPERPEPTLYKEFRFHGKVGAASGFLRPDVTPTTSYFLVFQGRGNGCDNAEDFTHWRLEINGPKAGYAFFGTTTSVGEKK
ncbi:MAG: hypothetical protein ABI999_01675 [Acidobacteriota bacterium]